MNNLSMFWGPWPFLKIINRFGKFARIGSLDSDTQERVQKKQKAQEKTEDDEEEEHHDGEEKKTKPAGILWDPADLGSIGQKAEMAAYKEKAKAVEAAAAKGEVMLQEEAQEEEEALVKVTEKQWPKEVVLCRPVPCWRPPTFLPVLERTGSNAKIQTACPDDRLLFAMEIAKMSMSEIMST